MSGTQIANSALRQAKLGIFGGPILRYPPSRTEPLRSGHLRETGQPSLCVPSHKCVFAHKARQPARVRCRAR